MILKQIQKTTALIGKKSITGEKRHIAVFTVMFAIFGSILFLYSSEAATISYVPSPPHGAQCIENSPSKTTVRPGENFTARVRIKNTGTSTFSPNFGVSLYEMRAGSPIWSASGLDLSGNIPPGQIATFNLKLKAPSSTGKYSFDWGILVVFQGFIRNGCTNKTITVANPAPPKPPAPKPNPTPPPAPAPAPKPNPTPPPAPAPAPKPAKPTPAPSPQPRPSAPTRPQPRPSNISGHTEAPEPTVDTPPPNVQDFAAHNEDGLAINLSWTAPAYEGTIAYYELERSIDNMTWLPVSENLVTGESFIDTDISYETAYFYRIRAVANNDLVSEFTYASTETDTFAANLEPEGTNLRDESGVINVYIPPNAIDEDANCNLLINTSHLPPSSEGYVSVLGPYELLCKNADGDVITNFKNPATIQVNRIKSYKDVRYYVLSDNWQEIDTQTNNGYTAFEVQGSTVFTAIGKSSSMPLIIKLLIGIVTIIGLIFGSLMLLNIIARIKHRREIEAKNTEYHKKEHGYI